MVFITEPVRVSVCERECVSVARCVCVCTCVCVCLSVCVTCDKLFAVGESAEEERHTLATDNRPARVQGLLQREHFGSFAVENHEGFRLTRHKKQWAAAEHWPVGAHAGFRGLCQHLVVVIHHRPRAKGAALILYNEIGPCIACVFGPPRANRAEEWDEVFPRLVWHWLPRVCI